MKNSSLIYLVAAMAVALPSLVRADEVKSTEKPGREEFREKLKNLSPEERRAKLREFREKRSEGRAEFEKLRQELKDLPPLERRAKLKEFRDKKVAELQKKKADGTLSEQDQRLLDRIEGRKRMEKPAGPKRGVNAASSKKEEADGQKTAGHAADKKND